MGYRSRRRGGRPRGFFGVGGDRWKGLRFWLEEVDDRSPDKLKKIKEEEGQTDLLKRGYCQNCSSVVRGRAHSMAVTEMSSTFQLHMTIPNDPSCDDNRGGDDELDDPVCCEPLSL